MLQRPASPVDLLTLPAESLALVRIIMRRPKLNLDQIAAKAKQSPEKVQSILNDLLDRGYIRQIETDEFPVFQANFERKREKPSSVDIWSALG